jgi:hypothetical protein
VRRPRSGGAFSLTGREPAGELDPKEGSGPSLAP